MLSVPKQENSTTAGGFAVHPCPKNENWFANFGNENRIPLKHSSKTDLGPLDAATKKIQPCAIVIHGTWNNIPGWYIRSTAFSPIYINKENVDLNIRHLLKENYTVQMTDHHSGLFVLEKEMLRAESPTPKPILAIDLHAPRSKKVSTESNLAAQPSPFYLSQTAQTVGTYAHRKPSNFSNEKPATKRNVLPKSSTPVASRKRKPEFCYVVPSTLPKLKNSNQNEFSNTSSECASELKFEDQISCSSSCSHLEDQNYCSSSCMLKMPYAWK